jgi:hypothetical protein
MITGCGEFSTLMKNVEALGGEAPPGVTAVLESTAVFRDVMAGRSGGQRVGSINGAVERAAKTGKPVTVDQAHDVCVAIVEEELIKKHLFEGRTGLDIWAAEIVQEMLRGDAGDQLMKSLQPVVDAAIEGVRAAAGFYSADTTAEQIVDRGAEAVAAWNGAKDHQLVLDQLLATVIRPMSQMALLPGELARDFSGPGVTAIWLINPSRAFMLTEVGVELMKPTTSWSVPGGRWLRIHQMAGLKLNSPREATAIFRGLEEAKRREDEERYKIVRADAVGRQKMRTKIGG